MSLRLAAALALAAGLMTTSSALAAAPPPMEAKAVLHADQPGPTIARDVYGQFSEFLGTGIYGGLWVGENSPIPNTRGWRNDALEALKRLHVPVIRWPGGCYADIYHWRDGIGPRSQRPVTLNTSWGGEETNAVGLHEFMDFAQMIGADVYLTGNLGTGSFQEMSEELEYATSDSHSTLAELRRKNGRKDPWKFTYFAVGNEPWGCGGQMRAEHYADTVRQAEMFVRRPGMRIIASGAEPTNYQWTETLLSVAGDWMNVYTLHDYTLPTGDWIKKGSATGFDETAWIATLAHALDIEGFIAKHSAIMDKYDPKKRIILGVDEWGTWYDAEPGATALWQRNTLRDALVAAETFNVFHRHADRVRMASISQTANVLQALILTDGARMTLTPTYHVHEMYRGFQDATYLPVEVEAPAYALGAVSVPGLQASAGRDAQGVVHLAMVNPDPHRGVHSQVRIAGLKARSADGRVLTADAMDAQNSFEHPDRVSPKPFHGAKLNGDALDVSLPPMSVVVLDLQP